MVIDFELACHMNPADEGLAFHGGRLVRRIFGRHFTGINALQYYLPGAVSIGDRLGRRVNAQVQFSLGKFLAVTVQAVRFKERDNVLSELVLKGRCGGRSSGGSRAVDSHAEDGELADPQGFSDLYNAHRAAKKKR